MSQILSHKMVAMVISTGRQVTVMKMLTLKMLSLFTVVKEPKKRLQMPGLFNSTGAKQKGGMNSLC